MPAYFATSYGCPVARQFRETFNRMHNSSSFALHEQDVGIHSTEHQHFFPPAPYRLTLHETEIFERLIADAVDRKLLVDGNGHLNRRLGNKMLRTLFAPTGDPHESY